MKNDDEIKMDRVRELLNDAKPAGSMYVLYLSLKFLLNLKKTHRLLGLGYL